MTDEEGRAEFKRCEEIIQKGMDSFAIDLLNEGVAPELCLTIIRRFLDHVGNGGSLEPEAIQSLIEEYIGCQCPECGQEME